MTSTVSTLWIGDELGPYEELCLRSFVAADIQTQVFLYDSRLRLPEGVVARDASEVVPVPADQRHILRPSTFSNLFRYRLLQCESTTWIDADLLLVGGELPNDSNLFGFQDQAGTLVNTAVLRLPSDSAVLDDLVAAASQADSLTARWGELGPELLTSALVKHRLLHAARPSRVFYPLDWTQLWRLYDPDQRAWCDVTLQGAVALHLWNQFLTKDGAKAFAPPPSSYMAERFARLGVQGPSEVMDMRWLRSVWRPRHSPRSRGSAISSFLGRIAANARETLESPGRQRGLS